MRHLEGEAGHVGGGVLGGVVEWVGVGVGAENRARGGGEDGDRVGGVGGGGLRGWGVIQCISQHMHRTQ